MKKLKQLIKYINDMKKFLLLLVLVLSLASCTENYSTGAKVGTVSEFTKKGLVWESWDGVLYVTQNGYIKTSEPLYFAFDNDRTDQDSLIKLVELVQEKGYKVKISYHKTFGKNWFDNRGGSDYFVTGVEIVDKDPFKGAKPADVAAALNEQQLEDEAKKKEQEDTQTAIEISSEE